MSDAVESMPFCGERIVVRTDGSFDTVLDALRRLMGTVALAEINDLANEPISERDFSRRVEERYVGKSGFMLFAEMDHGGWLPKFGIDQRVVRWILGNPLLAITMIRHDITAGLFAPVELLVVEELKSARDHPDVCPSIFIDGHRRQRSAARCGTGPRCKTGRVPG